MTSKEKALAVAAGIADKKGVDIQILDLGELCSFTDFFVIATGTSARHVQTLADAALDVSAKLGERVLGIEGEGAARWVLVDLGDVIVHLFLAEAREFFGLERLWGDAEALELPRAAGALR